MGEYAVSVPCSSCDYDEAAVFETTGGSDPPCEFFHTEWNTYDIDGYGPSFAVQLEPNQTTVQNFAFDTNEDGTGIDNYILYGRITGYMPVDNPPIVDITSPGDGQTIFDTHTVAATAVDDRGVSTVRFHVDNVLRESDSSAPYTFAWDTGAYDDGAHPYASMQGHGGADRFGDNHRLRRQPRPGI